MEVKGRFSEIFIIMELSKCNISTFNSFLQYKEMNKKELLLF